jgi:protein O-GlcNAc transferase
VKTPVQAEQIVRAATDLMMAGKFSEAKGLLEQFVPTSQNHLAIHLLGLANVELHFFEPGLKLLKESLQLAPERDAYWSDYVIALSRIPGRSAEMLSISQIALQKFPGLESVWTILANHFHGLRDGIRLLQTLEHGVAAIPSSRSLRLRLGKLLRELGDFDRSTQVLSRLISDNPNDADALQLMGNNRYSRGEVVDACAHWQRVLEIDPGRTNTQAQLLIAKRQICDWNGIQAILECVRRASEIRMDGGDLPPVLPLDAMSNFMDNHFNFRVAQAWAQLESRSVTATTTPAPGSHKSDRLTIGYLSNELRDHPVGHLLRSYFGYHDRNKIRSIVYFDHAVDGSDPVYANILSDCELHRHTVQLSDGQLSELIRSDGVDVLVSLKGWRAPTRMGVFARRTAPIQISYLGYPGTTGADFIDYVVADSEVVPPEHACDFSEKIARVGGSYLVNDDRQLDYTQLQSGAGSRAEHGLREDAIVLASFNQAYKLAPDIFSIWMTFLRAFDNTFLWLLPLQPECRKNLCNLALDCSVDPSRLIFADWADHSKHMARLTHADIGLDTLVYNGHTTTCEALWCRVPVVTMEGNHFASRVSTSVLRCVGLGELVTSNLDEYRQLGMRLIADAAYRESLRSRTESHLLRRTLFNTEAFVRDMEDLMEQMIDLHRRGEAPRDLYSRQSHRRP